MSLWHNWNADMTFTAMDSTTQTSFRSQLKVSFHRLKGTNGCLEEKSKNTAAWFAKYLSVMSSACVCSKQDKTCKTTDMVLWVTTASLIACQQSSYQIFLCLCPGQTVAHHLLQVQLYQNPSHLLNTAGQQFVNSWGPTKTARCWLLR